MTDFQFEDTQIFSVPRGSVPREILSHFLATHHAGSDDPFFVIDLGLLPQLLDTWRQLFPSIRPFYAVKCNPDSLMLSVLARLGVGFDCASRGELETVISVLSKSNRSIGDSIIYANPCKQLSHIKYAKQRGINLATFDNSSELHKHATLHPACQLVIRIAVDDSTSLCKLSNKFGCHLSSVGPLLQLARELGLSVAGVSFHVGSGCIDGEVFRTAIRDARNVFDTALVYGYRFTLLDIGGGFPSCPGTDPSPPLLLLQSISEAINSSLASLFSDWTGLQVIAEPGRFFAGGSHLLAVSVTSSRARVPLEGVSSECMYYVNEGVYGAFNCILFDHQEPKPQVLSAKKHSQLVRCSLWGPSCDGLDQILRDTQLPLLSVGDWLFFPQMGAYTRASRSDFNGFPAPINYYYVSSHLYKHMLSLLSAPQLTHSLDPLHPIDPIDTLDTKEEARNDRTQTLPYSIQSPGMGLLVSAII